MSRFDKLRGKEQMLKKQKKEKEEAKKNTRLRLLGVLRENFRLILPDIVETMDGYIDGEYSHGSHYVEWTHNSDRMGWGNVCISKGRWEFRMGSKWPMEGFYLRMCKITEDQRLKSRPYRYDAGGCITNPYLLSAFYEVLREAIREYYSQEEFVVVLKNKGYDITCMALVVQISLPDED